MTDYIYYKCEKCGQETSDKNGDAKTLTCSNCGNQVICTNKNQVIYCDFENNIEISKGWKKFFRAFLP